MNDFRHRQVPFLAFLLLALLLSQSVASANAGTPLMWTSMLHFFIGNAFILMAISWFSSSEKTKSVSCIQHPERLPCWHAAVLRWWRDDRDAAEEISQAQL